MAKPKRTIKAPRKGRTRTRKPTQPHGEASEIVRAIQNDQIDAVVVIQAEEERVFHLLPPTPDEEMEEIVRAIRHGEVDAFVVSDNGEERIYTLAAIEQTLRDSERRFRELADSMPCVVWIIAPDGYVTYLNQQWRSMGGPDRDLSGADWTAIVHSDDAPAAVTQWRQCLEQGVSMETEMRFVNVGSREARWHLVRIIPVRSAEGDILRWYGTATDIDQLKQLQRQLDDHTRHLEQCVHQRTLQLEESHARLRVSERLAAIGTLSAGLGHDMGNLLLPIRLRLDSIEQQMVPAQVREDVRSIRQCADYLTRLANGLRLFAMDPKTNGGDSIVSLSEWWPEVEPFFRNAVPRNVVLEHAFADHLPLVHIGRAAITQAVFNLVQNAGEAQQGQDHAAVRITAEGSRNDQHVRIIVTDNGPGMSDEVKQRCLEPFYTTKSRGISTGLGLALVHGIIQQAGGEIEIHSAPGEGTTFVLSIPAATDERRGSPATRKRPAVAISNVDDRRAALCASLFRLLDFEVRFNPAPGEADHIWVTSATVNSVNVAREFTEARSGRVAILFGSSPTTMSWNDSQNDGGIVFIPADMPPNVVRRTLHAIAQQVRGKTAEPLHMAVNE